MTARPPVLKLIAPTAAIAVASTGVSVLVNYTTDGKHSSWLWAAVAVATAVSFAASLWSDHRQTPAHAPEQPIDTPARGTTATGAPHADHRSMAAGRDIKIMSLNMGNVPAVVPIFGFFVIAVLGIAYVPQPSAHDPSPSPGSAPPGSSFATPAPTLNPAGSADPRAQIVQLTGSWSDQGFVDAIANRDTRIVALYLESGLKATTLHEGASAILWGFQGVPQNGDPVDLVKAFQANGFKVDDELEDGYLMKKLEDMFPLMFDSPLAPKGYTGGYMGGKFVGSLLFWIVQRASGWGPTDQDIQVINYLISQGADCKVPLAFFNFNSNTLGGTWPYQKLLPMMQSCAK